MLSLIGLAGAHRGIELAIRDAQGLGGALRREQIETDDPGLDVVLPVAEEDLGHTVQVGHPGRWELDFQQGVGHVVAELFVLRHQHGQALLEIEMRLPVLSRCHEKPTGNAALSGT